MQIRNMKPIVMKDAVDYLKSTALIITKVLSVAHRKLLLNVIEDRERN